jgi:hypothetical protein
MQREAEAINKMAEEGESRIKALPHATALEAA